MKRLVLIMLAILLALPVMSLASPLNGSLINDIGPPVLDNTASEYLIDLDNFSATATVAALSVHLGLEHGESSIINDTVWTQDFGVTDNVLVSEVAYPLKTHNSSSVQFDAVNYSNHQDLIMSEGATQRFSGARPMRSGHSIAMYSYQFG